MIPMPDTVTIYYSDINNPLRKV